MLPVSHYPVNQFQPTYTDQVYYDYRHLVHVNEDGIRHLVSVNLFICDTGLVIEFLSNHSLIGRVSFLGKLEEIKADEKIPEIIRLDYECIYQQYIIWTMDKEIEEIKKETAILKAETAYLKIQTGIYISISIFNICAICFITYKILKMK